MKKTKLVFVTSLVLLFFYSITNTALAQTNLALAASASTSYVSSWEKLDAIKDGYLPSTSMDKGPGAYGNWKSAEDYKTWNWVEYSFEQKSQIDSIRVYWWTDNGGILKPDEAFVEYIDCNSLVKLGDIGTDLNKFNSLSANVKAYKVRINMMGQAATGILELQVFGKTGEVAALVPYIQVNSQDKQQLNKLTANIGDTIVLSAGLVGLEGGNWSWIGPKGFTSTDSFVVINNIQPLQAGNYRARYSTSCGISFDQNILISMNNTSGSSYVWPEYIPKLFYDFRADYPDFAEPTKDLDDCKGVVGSQHSKWWIFKWGKNKRSVITEEAITPLLERMDKDFTYFRDSMNWPPDKRAKNGYYSAIYLYGSGLCTDGEDSTALGGWQGNINYKGTDWPMVLASYYPIYSFDPNCKYNDAENQRGAMVHEGIHALLADMPGCKEACWFQEGGNTWLQQEMSARQSNDFSSMGFLNGGPFIAPFMPIECYSGWLQDNSFGGPCAEGVNMVNSQNKQLCTWRNYLGGTQYGNSFPVFLAQTLGDASIPWIWQFCKGRVLEGLADSLGDFQIRRLITEYRAKQALIDFGKWSGALRNLMKSYTNIKIAAEYKPAWLTPEVWISTPYARTSMDSKGVLTPEYRTTPGWSGGNQIPLHVKSDSVYVNFKPIGKNMKCQICYRDISGNPVYSEPVDSGACAMSLKSAPANDVVIIVVSNTDYIFEGRETGKKHFDYRLQIDTNLVVPAHTHKKWFAWDENPAAGTTPKLAAISSPDTLAPTDLSLALEIVYENMKTSSLVGTLSTIDPNVVTLDVYTLVSGEGSTDNGYFKIADNKLFTKKLLDYEKKQTLNIRVRSTNLTGKFVEKAFTINVVDVVETSIENMVNSKNIQVYPNPVNQSTKVEMLNNEVINTIEIINSLGSTVRTIDDINSNQCIINKENLPNGIYYLKVNSSENYIVKVVFQ